MYNTNMYVCMYHIFKYSLYISEISHTCSLHTVFACNLYCMRSVYMPFIDLLP